MAIMSTVKIESTPKANSFPAKHIYTNVNVWMYMYKCAVDI